MQRIFRHSITLHVETLPKIVKRKDKLGMNDELLIEFLWSKIPWILCCWVRWINPHLAHVIAVWDTSSWISCPFHYVWHIAVSCDPSLWFLGPIFMSITTSTDLREADVVVSWITKICKIFLSLHITNIILLSRSLGSF